MDLMDMVKAAVALNKIISKGPGPQYINQSQIDALKPLLQWLRGEIEKLKPTKR